MDNRFDKIDDKLDKLDERLDIVDKHLAVYNEQLIFHIKRTELLEEKLEPVEKHVHFVNGAMWVAGGLGAILLALYSTGALQQVLRVLIGK